MTTTAFADHFSGHAGAYSAYRPRYPDALWAWLAEQAPARDHCWDAATGNGQAAVGLRRHFAAVHASDASAAQVALAGPCEGVTYAVESAEACGLPDASVDAIVVAQALHWFDFARFFAEAQRVLRPDGVLLACCYELLEIDGGGPIDGAIRTFYDGDIGPYWPPQRRHIERGYRDIAFPLQPLSAPPLAMRAHWDRDALLAYLGTWSAVRRHDAATGHDALAALRPTLEALWPAGEAREIVFPLTTLAGRTSAMGIAR